MADQQNKIPVYIINLERRRDRRAYMAEHFGHYPEFKPHFFNAIDDPVPAVGLYKSLHSIVSIAQQRDFPYVIICEDDHKFTDIYNRDLFFDYIDRAKSYSADVFLGGVSWFDCGVLVEEDLYWLKDFTGTQFLVIYSSFYQRILDTPFSQDDIIDAWMGNLADNIFIAVPMISVQCDFGYSDVTPKNNTIGRVDELFKISTTKWQTIKEVTAHIQKASVGFVSHNIDEGVHLPTYVINLAHKKDRLLNIKQQLSFRDEFDVQIVEAVNHNNRAVGLWESILKVVKIAKERGDEIILICEDDHVFCSGYNKNILWDAVHQGANLGADLILGGISNAEQAIPVSDCLCWISGFRSTQFTIIFSHFFETILSSNFEEFDTPDLKLSVLTANKYVIHPFVSQQKKIGYSGDMIDNFMNEQYQNKFEDCSAKIDNVRKVSQIAT